MSLRTFNFVCIRTMTQQFCEWDDSTLLLATACRASFRLFAVYLTSLQVFNSCVTACFSPGPLCADVEVADYYSSRMVLVREHIFHKDNANQTTMCWYQAAWKFARMAMFGYFCISVMACCAKFRVLHQTAWTQAYIWEYKISLSSWARVLKI